MPPGWDSGPAESDRLATAEILTSIGDIDRDAWNRCFPGELEDYDYHAAVEAAGVPGFAFRYIVVRDGDGLRAAAPAFLTAYRLDTTAEGAVRTVMQAIGRVLPGLMTLRLACLGSPVAEICHLGFAPDIASEHRVRLADAIAEGLDLLARREGIGFLAVKDLPAGAADAAAALSRRGFSTVPGQPTAVLPLPFPTFDDYMASLGRATRKDMRRKLRVESQLRIERRADIADVVDRIKALYDDTHAHSDVQFEELTSAYFAEVARRLPGRAFCYLYWHGDDLLAFNLVLQDQARLIDKFVGMEAERGRAFNLYFVSWLTNVRHCIEAGIPLYQSGQAGYATKIRLKSTLSPNSVHFRHRNPVVNMLLKGLAKVAWLGGDETGEGLGDGRKG